MSLNMVVAGHIHHSFYGVRHKKNLDRRRVGKIRVPAEVAAILANDSTMPSAGKRSKERPGLVLDFFD